MLIINNVTGRANNEVTLSSIFDPKRMNEYFQSINTDNDYIIPSPVHIPSGIQEFLNYQFTLFANYY